MIPLGCNLLNLVCIANICLLPFVKQLTGGLCYTRIGDRGFFLIFFHYRCTHQAGGFLFSVSPSVSKAPPDFFPAGACVLIEIVSEMIEIVAII